MAKNNPFALKFNGSNSWVRIPTKPELRIPNNFTLSACIYKLDNGYLPTGDILCNQQNGGYRIYSSSKSVGGSLYIGSYRFISYTLTDSELNENDYFFIHLTYDGSYMRLYLNGELVESVSQTGNVSHPTNVPLAIGANPNTSSIDSGYTFNGIIDNVSLWNKALTPEEVKYYMNRRLDGDEEGLVGYWSLDEGEGNIAHDLSPYQNHGTIYNAQWVEGEVDLKPHPPEPIDFISYNIKQKFVEDTILINWGASFRATRYELQYFQNEWITINNNITDTEYVYTFEQPNPAARFRVRGINEEGKTDWVEGEAFEVTYQSSIKSNIVVNPQSKMRGYIDIIGYGESDLDSNITIRQFHKKDLDSLLEISKKYEIDFLDSNITVAIRDSSFLDGKIVLNPSGRMRGYIDIVQPPKKVLKIYPIKDSVVRQSAPTINYGDSQQMLAGETAEGRFISYLGFDIELPEDIDEIESIKLVLHKQYETSIRFFMGVYETSDNWDEQSITWNYRPTDEKYIAQFVIPTLTGRVEADLTNLDWSNGRKSFILRPRNYSLSELTAFGTKESLNPPYIEITYYEKVNNANSYSLDSNLTVRRKAIRDISGFINVNSDYNYAELSCLVKLESKNKFDELEGFILLAQSQSSELGGELEIEAKPQETEINSRIIISYIEFLNANLLIEEKEGNNDLDSILTIRAYESKELDSSLEIEGKVVNNLLDSLITVKINEEKEIEGILEIEKKHELIDLDSSIILRRYEEGFIDTSLSIERKDKDIILDSDLIIRRKEKVNLESLINIPRYDKDIELNSEIYISFTSSIDSIIEIPKVDSEDEIIGYIELVTHPQQTDIGSSMVVRIFWVNELNSLIDVTRKFEISGSLAIEKKERVAELECFMRVEYGGDYVFIM